MEELVFKISDIYLSATLVATGFRLVSVERRPGGSRALFCFADDPKLVHYQEAFYRDELRMNPRDICRALKDVKRLLYEER